MAKMQPFWWFNPVLTCDDIKKCLEGDYTTWAFQWKNYYGGNGEFGSWYPRFVSVDENSNSFWVMDTTWGTINKIKLSDGTLLEEARIRIFTEIHGLSNHSLLLKYFAVIEIIDGVPYLLVYKDGSLKQSTNLFTTCSWNELQDLYFISISPDGKYILVSDPTALREYALFRGS